MSEVILVDAGTGNLRSVQKALESLCAAVDRTDDPQKVLSGKRVILPGVGAFGDFMSGLRARGLDDAVKDVVKRGIPLLEFVLACKHCSKSVKSWASTPASSLLAGKVTRFAEPLSVKIPHTGWNQVEVRKETLLFHGISSGEYVYFNHSYFCQPGKPSDIAATTDYGLTYTCAVQDKNIFGVQFHPEKSQTVGLKILKNFLEAA